ncbi:MAG: Rieske (2Fe-2S) protein [Thermoanaerobaculia bacterium]|nr:Rieske (2Fe-2S) protein [Thermoanaerobaculia bacterium]
MAAPRGAPVSSRRTFLGAIVALSGAGLAYAWTVMGGERLLRKRASRVSLELPSGDGVAFHGDVVIVTREGKPSAFSARCPHLGCRISRLDRGTLVCPCHGSRFDLSGQRLSGPANEDLKSLTLAPAKEQGKVDVDVPS